MKRVSSLILLVVACFSGAMFSVSADILRKKMNHENVDVLASTPVTIIAVVAILALLAKEPLGFSQRGKVVTNGLAAVVFLSLVLYVFTLY